MLCRKKNYLKLKKTDKREVIGEKLKVNSLLSSNSEIR
jgi:hypothetical protein